VRTALLNLTITFTMALAVLFALLPSRVMAADPNLNKQLSEAAKQGDLGQVKSLLSKGADLNVKTNYGATAMNSSENRKITEVLKAHGANE
jgi:ankyrin repeat protein